jgi:hypothetical protein
MHTLIMLTKHLLRLLKGCKDAFKNQGKNNKIVIFSGTYTRPWPLGILAYSSATGLLNLCFHDRVWYMN